MIEVEATSREQVQAALARELDCRLDSDALQRATIADHIRALVFGSWTRRTPEAAPLHTTRILSNVRRTQRFVWPQHAWEHEKLGDLCRQVLDDLEVLGDIVSAGNGFSIPGPSIFVELDAVNVMVSGGAPTQIARTHFATSVTSTAAFRFTPRRSVLSKSSNANYCVRSMDGSAMLIHSANGPKRSCKNTGAPFDRYGYRGRSTRYLRTRNIPGTNGRVVDG